MKTSLDNWIKKHAETFDDHIPPMGHFERFNERLERREKQRTLHTRRWIIATSVAAMVAIVLMFQYTPPATTDTLNVQPEAIAEIINFYNMRMTDEIDRLEKQLAALDETSRQDLLTDIEKMRKDAGNFNKQNAEINEEAYIAAIITHYNAQLESLEHIRTMLEKTQEEPYKS